MRRRASRSTVDDVGRRRDEERQNGDDGCRCFRPSAAAAAAAADATTTNQPSPRTRHVNRPSQPTGRRLTVIDVGRRRDEERWNDDDGRRRFHTSAVVATGERQQRRRQCLLGSLERPRPSPNLLHCGTYATDATNAMASITIDG